MREMEAVPLLKSCKWCGRIHDSSFDCGRRPAKAYRRIEEDRGRNTRAWRRKAEEVKERSHFLCAYCFLNGILTYDGLEAHHIIKLRQRPDLLLDEDNLVCLCNACHRMADSGRIDAIKLQEAARKMQDTPPGPA